MKKFSLSIWAIGALASVALAGASAVPTSGTAAFADPLSRPALHGPRALHGVMLAVATAGTRIVAAGERGVVLYSDDGAAHWQQADVPVSVTLTGLAFPTAREGFAIGHAGVVLHSTDGGLSWIRVLDGRTAARIEEDAALGSGDQPRVRRAQQLVGDGADKPFLALHFEDELHGFVVGAYGLIFATEDGGRTWSSWMGRVDNPRGLHLNAIAAEHGHIVLAGEQGILLRSKDAGAHFERLASPYKGSWFGAAFTGGHVVVAGLKGHAWWSGDEGTTWNESVVPAPVSFNSLVADGSGRLWFSNQAGAVFESDDGGRTLRVLPTLPGPPVTSLSVAPDGDLLLSTFAGVSRVPVTSIPAASASVAAATPSP